MLTGICKCTFCMDGETNITLNYQPGHFLVFFPSISSVYRKEPSSWCLRNYYPQPLVDTFKSKQYITQPSHNLKIINFSAFVKNKRD